MTACAAVAAGTAIACAAPASAAPYVYTANGNGTMSQFVADSVTGTLTLNGAGPSYDASSTSDPGRVVVSPDGHSVYVSDSGSNYIAQFDVGSDGKLTPKGVPHVAAGAYPYGIAITPDGAHLYAVNSDDSTVSWYDVDASTGELTPQGTVSTVEDQGEGIAVSQDGRSLYVSMHANDRIRQYDVAADGKPTPKTVAWVGTSSGPADVAVSVDGKVLYASTTGNLEVDQFTIGSDGALTAMSPLSAAPGPGNIQGGGGPLAPAPGGSALFAASPAWEIGRFSIDGDGKLTDQTTLTFNATAADIAVSPTGTSLYDVGGGTVSVRQYGITGTTVTAKAPATVATGSGGPPLPLAIAVTPQSDLAVTQTSGPAPASNGEEVRFTVSATNAGGTRASGVHMTDTLPSELTLVSASTPDGTCTTAGNVACDLTPLRQGQTATITVVARAVQAGTYSTTAAITALQPDPDSANNSVTTPATVAPRPGAISAPASDLGTSTATLNGVVAPAGSGVTYRFEYGTTSGYGGFTPATAFSGGDAAAVSAQLSGLQPGSTYHYRLVVTNGGNATVTGTDQTFTMATPAPAPAEVTKTVTVIKEGPPRADRTAPVVWGVALTAKQLRLSVSEAATAKATIAVRRLRHVRNGGRTRTVTSWVVVRRATVRARGAGPASVKLGRRLAKGRYRVTLVATDAARNASRAKTAQQTLR